MDADALIERRRLRRKLTFWRVAAILVAVAAVGIAGWWASPDKTGNDHIARITINGMITDDAKLVDLIELAAKDDKVKAIIVSLSTPGGTTYGGERIYKALSRAREAKPVVADVHTLAASAGYMIAAGTDHIVAGESSIVGSIGVLFQYPQIGDLLQKIGVSVNEIKSAPLKAEPSPFHAATPAAEAMIRSMVMDSFDWFVDLVGKERKMDRARVLTLADGSIFTGRQGLANGLVDALGGEAEIRAYLKGRQVADELEIVDWKPVSDTGTGILPRIMALAAQQLGGPQLSLTEEVNRLGGGKLFLDGLVSVWQGGAPSKIAGHELAGQGGIE